MTSSAPTWRIKVKSIFFMLKFFRGFFLSLSSFRVPFIWCPFSFLLFFPFSLVLFWLYAPCMAWSPALSPSASFLSSLPLSDPPLPLHVFWSDLWSPLPVPCFLYLSPLNALNMHGFSCISSACLSLPECLIFQKCVVLKSSLGLFFISSIFLLVFYLPAVTCTVKHECITFINLFIYVSSMTKKDTFSEISISKSKIW